MGRRVVVIGELLYDVFEDGERLGGAPANFAYHAAQLGADVHLISAVGDDERGRSALGRLADAGVDISGVSVVPDRRTGIVPVSLDASGHPTFEIVEDVAWDETDLLPSSRAMIADAELVYWGTLGQRSCRSRQAHRQLFDLVPDHAIRMCDINFRQHFHDRDVVVDALRRARLLKLSDEEIPILRRYADGPSDPREYVRHLRRLFGIETAVLTLGVDGCRVFADNVDFKAPGQPVSVVDTVGAGDAFAAAFAVARLDGADLKSCADRANRHGAFVASREGGMPALPETVS